MENLKEPLEAVNFNNLLKSHILSQDTLDSSDNDKSSESDSFLMIPSVLTRWKWSENLTYLQSVLHRKLY